MGSLGSVKVVASDDLLTLETTVVQHSVNGEAESIVWLATGSGLKKEHKRQTITPLFSKGM